MENIDNIIFYLLILDGNETNLIDKYEGLKYEDYINLVKEMVMKKYDIRYCNSNTCRCHPEHKLRKYIENKQLRKFLKNYMWGYYDELIELVNQEYEAKTVFEPTKIRGFIK